MAEFNQSQYQDLIDASLRRPLTPAEEADLRRFAAAQPEGLPELEADLRLAQCLRELRDAPISSNFTSALLRQIEREPTEAGAPARWWSSWSFLPGLRYATAVLVAALLALLSYQQYAGAARASRARQIAEVTAL